MDWLQNRVGPGQTKPRPWTPGLPDSILERSDSGSPKELMTTGLHISFHPTIRDGSTWNKFRASGEHGDFFLFSKERKLTFVDV